MSQKRIMNLLRIAKLAILSLYWDWITLPKGFRVSVATVILAAIALFVAVSSV
jgi:hypothetical protein